MMAEAQVPESNILENLRQILEARGLKFYINPPRDIIPKFLGDFQPDAIALGPEGGVVVEVKHRRGSQAEQQLAEIARRVADQKGWEFRIIYLNPSTDEMPPIAKPSFEQLQAIFREIEALTKGGYYAAALLTAWAALEALARLAGANNEGGMRRGATPIQAVQTLAEEGYIESEPAERIREMARLRNAVVHGDFSVAVSAEQVEYLLKQLQVIASDIMSVTRELDD
jgi:uncharacterized protein YutE (UPF0331/DUF86 family)